MPTEIEVLIDQAVLPPGFNRRKLMQWIIAGKYKGRAAGRSYFVTVYESNFLPVPRPAESAVKEVNNG